MTPQLHGIHHVSATVSDPQRNVDFYVGVLGLRMIKKTVNFDDPGMYHLYYGDETGTPGTLMTFFIIPGIRRGRQGVGQTGATAFAVPVGALGYWAERLRAYNAPVGDVTVRFGDEVLPFADPDGLPLELVAQAGLDAVPTWRDSPVPEEYRIRGFHSVTLWEENDALTDRMLAEILGYRRVAQDGNRIRYEIADGGTGTRVDILHQPGGQWAIGGAGTVHHVAFRTPDDAQQLEWLDDLRGQGFNATPVQPRFYFNSIYFREPGGVLFEIATDPPGMLVDESLETLGQSLKLPPWFESQRELIEQHLPPLTMPSAVERNRD